MSHGDFGEEDDIDNNVLDELMNGDVDEQSNEEEVEAVGTPPVLNNIWECPMLSKTVTVDEDSGRSYTGWSCSGELMQARHCGVY
jgi:hypothetical protein